MKRKDFVNLLNVCSMLTQVDDKLGNSAKLLLEELKPFADTYNRELKHLRLSCAFVDKDGCLVLTEKGEFKFTPEGFSVLEEKFEEFALGNVEIEHLKNKFLVNPKECMRLQGDIPEELNVIKEFLI
jgi:hypothetical protein